MRARLDRSRGNTRNDRWCIGRRHYRRGRDLNAERRKLRRRISIRHGDRDGGIASHIARGRRARHQSGGGIECGPRGQVLYRKRERVAVGIRGARLERIFCARDDRCFGRAGDQGRCGGRGGRRRGRRVALRRWHGGSGRSVSTASRNQNRRQRTQKITRDRRRIAALCVSHLSTLTTREQQRSRILLRGNQLGNEGQRMTTHAHRSERPPATPLSSFKSAGERTFPRPEALRPHLAVGLPHARNRYSRITVLGIRAAITHCNSSPSGDTSRPGCRPTQTHNPMLITPRTRCARDGDKRRRCRASGRAILPIITADDAARAFALAGHRAHGIRIR